jgi:hypothetical protein
MIGIKHIRLALHMRVAQPYRQPRDFLRIPGGIS